MLNRRIAVLALFPLASAASAQPGPRVRAMDRHDATERVAMGGGSAALATRLINARRALNLTPRQVVALDSIERAAVAERRRIAAATEARRDSICANRRPCALSREERLQLLGGSNRIGANLTERLKTDSVRRTRILGMLDTTQRRMVDRMLDRQTAAVRGARPGTMRRGGRDFGPQGRGGAGPRGLRGRDFGPMDPGPRRRTMRPGDDRLGRGGRMQPGWRDDQIEPSDTGADTIQGPRRGAPGAPQVPRRRPGEPGDSIPGNR